MPFPLRFLFAHGSLRSIAALATAAGFAAVPLVVACGSSQTDAGKTVTLPDGAVVPAGGSGCAAHPSAGFCDDFENETDAVFAKNWPSSLPSGDLEFLRPTFPNVGDAFSGTHVLHTDAPFVFDAGASDPGQGQRFMVVSRGMPTVLESQSVHVGFVMRIVSFPNSASSGVPSPVAQVNVEPVDASRGGTLVQFNGLSASQLSLEVLGYNGSPVADLNVPVPFAIGQWMTVDVETNFVKGTSDAGAPTFGTTSVSVDGQKVASTPFANIANQESKTYDGVLTLGSFGFQEEPDTVVDFDDVYIEQK